MHTDHGAQPQTATLQKLAEERLTPAEAAPFQSFVQAYYALASSEALGQRDVEQRFQIAYAHWQLSRQRSPREPLLECHSGNGEDAALTVLRMVTDDMPFLMGSVLQTLRSLGAAIDWTVHPVLTVARDASGTLLGLVEPGAEPGQARPESFIHIECEYHGDSATLTRTLAALLADLRTTVADYAAMRQRLQSVADALRTPPADMDAAEFVEARSLLQWLHDDHFTLLGYAHSQAHYAADAQLNLQVVPADGLGLTRSGGRFADASVCIAPADELNKYASGNRVVVITKANEYSPIHHHRPMDVVSVKYFHADGRTAGTHRFIGLFSSEVYSSRPHEIPLVRRKAEYVLQRAGLAPTSYSDKRLRSILRQLPRDELFQSSEEELYATCMGIRALHDRNPLRLFLRRDRYGRFFSMLIYLPREQFSRGLRERIATELLALCHGLSQESHVEFLVDGHVRMHCIVRTRPGSEMFWSAAEIETRLLAATRSWSEQLSAALSAASPLDDAQRAREYAGLFPLSYQEHTPVSEAVADIGYLQRLSHATPLLSRLLLATDADGHNTPTALKLYSQEYAIALSDILPTLENFGLHVISQEATALHTDALSLWLHNFNVTCSQLYTDTGPATGDTLQQRFASAFAKCWAGETEDDGLQQLVVSAGLDWRQVLCLRVLTRYLLQSELPYSQAYLESLLIRHGQIATQLVALFEQRHNPALDAAQRAADCRDLEARLHQALEAVSSLDADRALRAYLSVIQSSLRCNFYQRSADGTAKPCVSLKLDPAGIPELPLPRAMYETFVYASQVEGIHLRGGAVARGGLRWSDRRADFRTEILGLLKAQMVKNAIIVPVGAKGGFVLKQGDPSQREDWQQRGLAAYKIFLGGLLDLTDNRVGQRIVAPRDLVRHDGDDPYLVIAADKGTAGFSDIANAVAANYDFWLGDAFASGGSAGYDHKAMGITAGGAWECVKRHFRERNKDIQTTAFTAIGIGDMSGDVFGNGLLQSRQTRLVAAFDHRHIFIDPDPQPGPSYTERQRLYALARSSWDDYRRELISAGGGVWPRSAKSIPLSAQVRALLGVEAELLRPNQMIQAILRAPAELLWFGGIGTYVKGQNQAQDEVGDRSNDGVRINARELRCQVIGEGANLGLTQAARVEFALAGGAVNTDAIDNAGGVHCSDREVNIKIPLNAMLAEGIMSRAQRDPLLAALTEEISAAVLRGNYQQSAAISQLQHSAPQQLDEHARHIRRLEHDGMLEREVAGLPDEEAIDERRKRGQGLTRPELAVLMAYSKLALHSTLLESTVVDDPYFNQHLLDYFPQRLVATCRAQLLEHRLRREIIATLLANLIVNQMGFDFAHRHAEEHGSSRAQVVAAYAVAHDLYRAPRWWQAISAQDNRLPAALQYRLHGRCAGLLRHVSSWLLRFHPPQQPVTALVAGYQAAITELEALLPNILTPAYRQEWEAAAAVLREDEVPEPLATSQANTLVMGCAPDLIQLGESTGLPLAEVAQTYFQLGEMLHIVWLHEAIVALEPEHQWAALARGNLREDTYRLHRQLTQNVLEQPGQTPAQRLQAWQQAHASALDFMLQRIQALQHADAADFSAVTVAVRELRKLRRA